LNVYSSTLRDMLHASYTRTSIAVIRASRQVCGCAVA